MPRGDGTGPAGQGPMTGRGAGYCAGYGVPGYMNPGPRGGYGAYGGGFRGGRGRRGGYRNWYRATGMPGWQRAQMGMPAWGSGPGPVPGGAYGPAYGGAPSADQELQMLQDQAEQMEQALSDIRERIQELKEEVEAE
ncbi:MAG: DUF5320 domain-containing protein [Planctomycetota bacterium]